MFIHIHRVGKYLDSRKSIYLKCRLMSCKPDGSDLTANCQFGLTESDQYLGKKGCFWNFFRVLDYCQLLRGAESFIWEVKILLKFGCGCILLPWEWKAGKRSCYIAALVELLCTHTHKSLEIQFSPWIRSKEQLRNWACNSSDHGPHSTCRQPNVNCLGPEPVFTNYLSVLLFLSF